MNEIIKPAIFKLYKNIIAATSTMCGSDTIPYKNNQSFWVGDDKVKVQSNRNRFFSSLSINQDNLAIPQQIHSDHVKIINAPGYYKDTDGLITSEKEIYLIISTADCYPVQLYDPVKNVIAAVHSGWRGTQKNITGSALSKMQGEYSCKMEDVKAYIGCGISCENFEVGKDVSILFDNVYVKTSVNKDKYLIDLRRCITDQLVNSGVRINNIEISGLCTFKEKDYLHSYRRDKESSGRMFSVIGMKY